MPQTFEPQLHLGSPSCIAGKFGSMVMLSDSELSVLEHLEEEEKEIGAGDVIPRLEDGTSSLLVVKRGWLISEHTCQQGYRTIVRCHHPGDMVGLSDLAYRNPAYQSVAKSQATISLITRASFKAVLMSSPRLASVFLAMSMIEQSQQDDRARMYSRNRALGKLALFILQTRDRLKLMPYHSADRFYCPLTQVDIGDLLGLTNVHVSRTLKKLEDAKLIKRHRSFIQVLDIAQLEFLASYTNRFTDFDFSWLPDLP